MRSAIVFAPDCGRNRIQKTAGETSLAAAEIARILLQEDGENCVPQHGAVEVIRIGSTETLGVSLHPLAVPGKVVFRLAETRIEGGDTKGNWIRGSAESEVQLLLARQRSRI